MQPVDSIGSSTESRVSHSEPRLLLGFQGTKTARREGTSSPFSDAGGCTSRRNSGRQERLGVRDARTPRCCPGRSPRTSEAFRIGKRAVSREISIGDFRRRIRPSAASNRQQKQHNSGPPSCTRRQYRIYSDGVDVARTASGSMKSRAKMGRRQSNRLKEKLWGERRRSGIIVAG